MSDVKFSHKGGGEEEAKVTFMSGTPKAVPEDEKGKNVSVLEMSRQGRINTILKFNNASQMILVWCSSSATIPNLKASSPL